MKIFSLAGQLPASLHIIRRQFAYLQDSATGRIVPALLQNEEGLAPTDDEIKKHLSKIGYEQDQSGRFELAKPAHSTVPSPSVN